MRSILIILLFAPPAVAAEVTATRLDGQIVSGQLQSWNDQRAVIATITGPQKIPSRELLKVKWVPAEGGLGDFAAQIELTDGSIIPVTSLTVNDTLATATAAIPAAADASPSEVAALKLSRKQLAAVILKPLSGDLAGQWAEIRDLKPAADVMVVLKRGGQSLDYVEGVIGDISADEIAFELDGDEMKVDRNKVAALLFFRRDEASERDPRATIRSRSGLSVNAARMQLDGSNVRITTLNELELTWPVDDLTVADYSAGKLLYLSDLDAASTVVTPLVAMPVNAKLAQSLAQPRRDQSSYGGPLTLAAANGSGKDSAGIFSTFSKGITIRSKSELTYRLPAGFRRLTAVAGIDPAAGGLGSVRLTIFGDDQALFEADVAAGVAPRSIDVDVEGVKRLKFVVDYGANQDTGDWLNLCDLKIVK